MNPPLGAEISASPSLAASSKSAAAPRFSLPHWPLDIIDRAGFHSAQDQPLGAKAASTRYPFRQLRYWWPTAAIRDHAQQLRRTPQVLDAGCQGGFLKRFADPVVQAHWTGLDFKLDNPHLPRAGYDELVHADLDQSLPFESNSFDVITSLHVFEHLRFPEKTLLEYARILRPGGLVLLAFPTMPGWLATWREASHRRQIRKGVRAAWAHQQVFHPYRCEAMAYMAGLEVELLAGSHFFRKTGFPLESQAWWVRLNQYWGACFPSLGSELCIAYRKPLS